MNCPICQAKLVMIDDGVDRCPAGHGILMTAKNLRGDNEPADETKIMAEDSGDGAKHAQALTCPNCGAKMSEADYGNSGVIIDTCLHCPYRWLDGGELKKIRGRNLDQGKLDPSLMLALQNFEAAEAGATAADADGAAEEVAAEKLNAPGWTSNAGLMDRLGAPKSSPLAPASARQGGMAGLYAVVKLATGPVLGRILLGVVVLAFAVIFFYALSQFR